MHGEAKCGKLIVFLAWYGINALYIIDGYSMTASSFRSLSDVAQSKLSANNIFTIAKRTVEGQASCFHNADYLTTIDYTLVGCVVDRKAVITLTNHKRRKQCDEPI